MNNNLKYELPYRQIHLDFHTSPYIGDIGKKFDKDEFADMLVNANVNSINLFAKCHHGMYYYPTKIGTVHPHLKFDLLGEQISACRDRGIKTNIYTTVVWNEDWADRHPEWMQVNFNGLAFSKKPFEAMWRSLCCNHKAHKEYLKAEIKEMYDLYKPDGFWIDIILQFQCICIECQKSMKAIGLDPSKNDDVSYHDRLVVINVHKEIYEFIKDMDDELSIVFNGIPCEMDMGDEPEISALEKRRYNTHIDIESLPSDWWGYTHFSVVSNFVNKYEQQLTMMNGKFHKAWGDLGSLRNLEALEYECYRGIANGTKVCIGDQLHPSGMLEKTVYERIGQIYSEIKKKEPWLINTKKLSQIGVYTGISFKGKVKENESFADTADIVLEGVYRVLSELGYQFDFIRLDDEIDKYEMLIMPDYAVFSEDYAEKIKKYIKDGGKLFIAAKGFMNKEGDKFALNEEIGVKYISDAEFCPRYINIKENTLEHISPMDYVMYEKGVTVEALPGAEVIAYVSNPYFNRSYDKFCSHRHTPSAGVTSEPCIIKKDNVIYISNPLFRDYAKNGNQVFKNILKTCMGMLIKNPLLKYDMPSTVEVTLRKQGNNLVLHVLNYIIQRKFKTIDTIEERWPLYNVKISVKTSEKPINVINIPENEELDFLYKDGYVEFIIPYINGHQMVLINMNNKNN